MERIQPESKFPLYLQLKEILVKKIKAGELKTGDKLPSEKELCETYSVSRITARQALAELAKEGLINRSHGKGTFVAEPKLKLEQQLFQITPFNNSLLSKGIKPETKLLSFKIIPNSYHMSKTLNIPLAQNITELTLLGLGDNEPVSFYTSYHSQELGEKVHEIVQQFLKEDLPFTTIDLFSKLPKISLGNIYQNFEASVADPYISNILSIKKGSPILIVESTLYDIDDHPLEYRTAIYRGDKYKFSTVRKLK